jgi:NAD(P)-dependent dehydrogenase (short-subunit alcohol dehydrogenase family)
MSLLALLKGAGSNGFGNASTAEKVTHGLDLTGKSYLITGCSSGLGLETLRVLGLRGAYLIALARSAENARRALDSSSATGMPVTCDLSEPASVRACVKMVKQFDRPLNGIICNAGIMALPKLEQKYGIERQFLTNYIGHFILVTGLLETLADDGRTIIVSSSAHRYAGREGIAFDNLSGERGYSAWKAYGQSKLACLLFAKELARKFSGSHRTANALHPGFIRTNLQRHMNPMARTVFALIGPLLFKSIPQGAATQCYLAAHPDAATVSGQYYADCNPARPSSQAEDQSLAARLWEVSKAIEGRLTAKASC